LDSLISRARFGRQMRKTRARVSVGNAYRVVTTLFLNI
jgi:hypothetical protein